MYTLSDYTITKNGEIINKHSGKKLKPQPNSKGYLRVRIGGSMMFVHRLVAMKYIPNPENKPQINHKDGNKRNNHVDNLEWVSNYENMQHAVRNGLHVQGGNCPSAKLTKADVDFIRANKKESISQLAEKFDVSCATIRDILAYRTWKTHRVWK